MRLDIGVVWTYHYFRCNILYFVMTQGSSHFTLLSWMGYSISTPNLLIIYISPILYVSCNSPEVFVNKKGSTNKNNTTLSLCIVCTPPSPCHDTSSLTLRHVLSSGVMCPLRSQVRLGTSSGALPFTCSYLKTQTISETLTQGKNRH